MEPNINTELAKELVLEARKCYQNKNAQDGLILLEKAKDIFIGARDYEHYIEAKNLMGVELEGSVYFDLSEKNMVRVIADDSVPGVESVYQNAPNKLFNYIMAYYDFSEAIKKHGTRIDMYLHSVNSISKKGNLHDNFFAWKSCYSEADNYNERVKAVQAAWKALQDNSTPEALDRVKRSNEFKIYDGESCIEAREIDIHVSGDFMGWEGNFKFKE